MNYTPLLVANAVIWPLIVVVVLIIRARWFLAALLIISCFLIALLHADGRLPVLLDAWGVTGRG